MTIDSEYNKLVALVNRLVDALNLPDTDELNIMYKELHITADECDKWNLPHTLNIEDE